MSTSMPRTGIWKPQLNCYAISPAPERNFCREGGHDIHRTAHRGIPPRAPCPTARCQPTHLRLLCIQFPIAVRIRVPEAQDAAFGAHVGATGRDIGQHVSGAPGNDAPELSENAKCPTGGDPIILPFLAAS